MKPLKSCAQERASRDGYGWAHPNRRWLEAVGEAGCLVCRLFLFVYTPCEIHHVDGKTKPGAHKRTLGLCWRHHRSGEDCEAYTSRHPHKARFELRYGTEAELLEKQREILDECTFTTIA